MLGLKDKESEEWYQDYEYNLVQRISVVSNDQQGLTMNVVGENLLCSKITGMADRQDHAYPGNCYRYCSAGAAEASCPCPGDPLGMYSPVTLELRDVSVRKFSDAC